jgi:hypothetical protein
MASVTYEVLVLRYGIFDGRLQYQNYLMPDDWPMARTMSSPVTTP